MRLAQVVEFSFISKEGSTYRGRHACGACVSTRVKEEPSNAVAAGRCLSHRTVVSSEGRVICAWKATAPRVQALPPSPSGSHRLS